MGNRTPVVCVILCWFASGDGDRGGDCEVSSGCTHIPRSGARLVLLIKRLVLLNRQRDRRKIILVKHGGVSVCRSAVCEREPGRDYVRERGRGGIGDGPGPGRGEFLERGEGG